jgi:broad specificity phosphatase PhoE
MPRLVFVRHAVPQATPEVEPADWPLSEEGVAAARALELPAVARILASDEQKAIETVSLASGGSDIVVDADFGEVRRVESFDGDFRERRRAWIRGSLDERHIGWEPRGAVALRMGGALRRHRADTMVIGTHGMALTAWLVHAGVLPAGESAARYWERLEFPHVVRVETDEDFCNARFGPPCQRLPYDEPARP